MLVKYNSNNSGGDWWLKDEDWYNLEKVGWKVDWYANEKPSPSCEYCEGTGKITSKGLEKMTLGGTKFLGRRCFLCMHGKDNRRLGALATKAEKEFSTIQAAIEEFEKITGQSATDEGCNCCGPPHTFEWHDEKGRWQYCSGEGCLQYLFPDKQIPKNIRECLEK